MTEATKELNVIDELEIERIVADFDETLRMLVANVRRSAENGGTKPKPKTKPKTERKWPVPGRRLQGELNGAELRKHFGWRRSTYNLAKRAGMPRRLPRPEAKSQFPFYRVEAVSEWLHSCGAARMARLRWPIETLVRDGYLEEGDLSVMAGLRVIGDLLGDDVPSPKLFEHDRDSRISRALQRYVAGNVLEMPVWLFGHEARGLVYDGRELP